MKRLLVMEVEEYTAMTGEQREDYVLMVLLNEGHVIDIIKKYSVCGDETLYTKCACEVGGTAIMIMW